jgi:hypothetical protein
LIAFIRALKSAFSSWRDWVFSDVSLAADDLLLQLVQQVGDRFAGRQGDIGDRGRPVEALLHRAERADIRPLVLGDGPDGGVVLGSLDLQARGDATLHIRQAGVGRGEVLQRDLRGDIGMDAIRHPTRPFEVSIRLEDELCTHG